MRQHQTEFTTAAARIAAVGLGNFEYARRFREDSAITFPLLVDEERIAYRALELNIANPLQLFSPQTFLAGARATFGGHRQHRPGAHPMQLGGSFIFGPGDRDIFVHVNRSFGDNPTPAKLLNMLERKTA